MLAQLHVRLAADPEAGSWILTGLVSCAVQFLTAGTLKEYGKPIAVVGKLVFQSAWPLKAIQSISVSSGIC